MRTKDFDALVVKWQDEKLITNEQAQQMMFELNQLSSENSGKKFIYSVGILGGLALSAGILLMISSNWSDLGKGLQLLLALMMPLITISLAYYALVVRQSQSIWGKVVNLLGMFLIGGSLAMIGQIYNLGSGYAGLLTTWAILSSLFIFVFKREENVAFTALAVGVALFTQIMEKMDVYGSEQSMLLTLTFSSLLYAGFLYSVGNILRNSLLWRGSARAVRLLSASVSTGTLFFTTFEFYAREITDSGYQDAGWMPLSIIFNVVFIGFIVFVLMRAIKYQEEHVAMNAIRLLGFYLIVKYFTLFSDMLETGLLMTVGGLLFIVGAWYLEKNKNQLLSLMKREGLSLDTSSVQSQTKNYE